MSTTLVAAAIEVTEGVPGAVGHALAAMIGRIEKAGGALMETRRSGAVVAFEDQLESPKLLDGLARTARERHDVDVRVAAHLGVRLRNPNRPGALALGTRCVQLARTLTAAAQRSEMVLSEELGTMIGLTLSGKTPFLSTLSRHVEPLGLVRLFRFDPMLDPLLAPTWQPRGLLPSSTVARTRLAGRLAEMLIGDLGPVAPMLLEDLVGRALRADEVIAGVLRYLPAARHERVRDLVEREVQRATD
jgi:hypothetical protein